MDGSSESHERMYYEVLAGIVTSIPQGRHGDLLKRVVDAERTLLSELNERQREQLWRYRECLDELHVLYQRAAFDGGRQAEADTFAEAVERMTRILSDLGMSLRSWTRQKQAENRGDLAAG